MTTRTILVLGASGRTGKLIVEYALHKGYKVIALVRKPEAFKMKHQNLEVVEGSPYRLKDVERAMKPGLMGVISALNNPQPVFMPWLPEKEPADVIERSIINTIKVMRANQNRRLIVVSADGTGESFNTANSIIKWMIANTKIGIVYADHNKAENALKESGLEWTSVRPVGLNNKDEAKTVDVTYNAKAPSSSISRKSVAKFIVDSLVTNVYINKAPTIST